MHKIKYLLLDGGTKRVETDCIESAEMKGILNLLFWCG